MCIQNPFNWLNWLFVVLQQYSLYLEVYLNYDIMGSKIHETDSEQMQMQCLIIEK